MKEVGKHDFSGSCTPDKTFYWNTFSVGIFEWVQKAGGKGLKKSAVKYRVKGYSSNPEAVYARAKEICEKLDNGEILPAKSCFVK